MPAKKGKIVVCTCNDPVPPPGAVIPKKKPQKASTRAGLIFSVARVHGMTKEKLKGTEDRLRRYATIYMTGALEKICEEIIVQTLQEAKRLKRVRITPYHLSRVVHGNPAWAKILKIAEPDKFAEHKGKAAQLPYNLTNFIQQQQVPTQMTTVTANAPVVQSMKQELAPDDDQEEEEEEVDIKPKKKKKASKPKKPKQTKPKKATNGKKKKANSQVYDLMIPSPMIQNSNLTGMEMLITNNPFSIS